MFERFILKFQQTIGQWRLVFLISAANLGLSCIVHLIWGTSEEQPWNKISKNRSDDAEEAPEENKLLTTETSRSENEFRGSGGNQ